MIFDPNESPCRNCKNAETRSKESCFEAAAACTADCVELACYQKALSIAEKIGEQKPGQCAICRRPSDFAYCGPCCERVKKEIAHRNAPIPNKHVSAIPKKPRVINPKKMSWFVILKSRSIKQCEICLVNIPEGEEVMARHTSVTRGNYRYAHRDCVENWEEEKAA